MKRVILITSHELRHKFLCHYLNSQKNIDLLYAVHEKIEKLSDNKNLKIFSIFKKHINDRKISEIKYFKKYKKKYHRFYLKKGYVNQDKFIKKIKSDNPDYIITFGCSILKDNFIKNFGNITFNIHLGLSPYYRGSGTNFFPFVYKELHFIGSTIMKISKKIDDGYIVTQVRPEIKKNDKIHDIGNKVILKTAKALKKIILSKKIRYYRKRINKNCKYFRRKDFTISNLKKAYYNLNSGMIKDYLKNRNKLIKKFPIIEKY